MDQVPVNIPQDKSFLSQLWSIRKDLTLIGILGVITALYILLMLRDSVPPIGLYILALLWLVYWVISGHLSKFTPFDLPLLGLLVLLPINLIVSIDRSLTLPKVYGLVLGIVFCYAIVNVVRNLTYVKASILALIFLSLVTALLGLLGVQWSETRFPFFAGLFKFLPGFQTSILEVTNRDGINSNTIGGTLVFFVPLLVSLLWDRDSFVGTITKKIRHLSFLRLIYKVSIVLILLFVILMLVVTNSRSAWFGSIIGLLVLLIWKDRRFLLVIPILLVGSFFVLHRLGVTSVPTLISLLEAGGDSSVSGRLEAWRNAVYILRDFPFTGIGLGTFSLPYNYFYTYITESLQGARYFHSHNMLLSVAVDMGVPALVLYAAILGSFFSMARSIYRSTSPLIRALVIGLTCGMLSHQVFGILDAFTLGKKMGIIMWVYFGLMSALFIHKAGLTSNPLLKGSSVSKGSKLFRFADHHRDNNGLLIGLVLWILITLVSIAFVNLNIYISLSMAIVGGIVLGVLLAVWFENRLFHNKLSPRKT